MRLIFVILAIFAIACEDSTSSDPSTSLGDKGATLTVSRDFPNGWKVGGFLTLTDAPFAAFGEGSFDKGIFLRLPINSLVPYETNSFVEERIRPIQGDGGQQIILPIRLYDLIKDKNKRDLDNSWSKIWR